MTDELHHLKFPIGEYQAPVDITAEQRSIWIDTIAELPAKLDDMLGKLSKEQLSRQYRPDGWTGIQVVHHIADSHINSYMRFKLALTEKVPTIRPYDERAWAEMKDGKEEDLSGSLELIRWIHLRLTKVMRNMSEEDWRRTFYHPESKTTVPLDWNLGMYAWHGEHHLAHLRLLVEG